MIIAIVVIGQTGVCMAEEKTEEVATGECGACRAIIPLDSDQCPECNISFSGVSDEALGECGACHGLVPLDSTKCTHCGTVFIAEDVVDVLRNWLATTGITIPMLFQKFDADGDGQIDSTELKTGLLSLNLADLPPSQVERLIETIDADGDGQIDLEELHATITGEPLQENAPVDEDHSDNEEDEEIPAEDEIVDEDDADESDAGELESSDKEDEEETSEEDVEEEEIEEEEVDSASENGEEEPVEDEDHSDEEDSANEDDAATEGNEFDDEIPEESESLIRRIADAMDEDGISPNRFFNDLDKDGSGDVDVLELTNALTNLLDDEVTSDDIEEFLSEVDDDSNRSIDMIEFITALEALDDADEAADEDAIISKKKEPKPFPTEMQKKMMGKQWNDVVWPLIHLAFGVFVALIVLNAFGGIGPLSVDGTGGPVALSMGDSVHPDKLVNGEIYECDPEYQIGDCKNSLTPLAGESSSMPAGWYWDGILFAVLGVASLCGSLYAHLIVMKSWRARAKAMKEVKDDKADAEEEHAEEESSDDEGSESLEEEMDEALEDDYDSEELEDEEDDEEFDEDESYEETDDSDEGDDEIDIGSHIGLTLDEEEVFGTIIEFDDEEETVTIEEDETGDIITGYQEDMFVE
jgi:Ca2+-binding EF-hand superfamily protein/RNA polymerase subunit RPABC4/transcription elongation factor Spt4